VGGFGSTSLKTNRGVLRREVEGARRRNSLPASSAMVAGGSWSALPARDDYLNDHEAIGSVRLRSRGSGGIYQKVILADLEKPVKEVGPGNSRRLPWASNIASDKRGLVGGA